MRRAAAAVALLAVVVLAALLGLGGYVTRDRDVVTSNPGLAAYTSIARFEVPAGALACVAPVSLEEGTERARFRIGAPPGRVAPLEVTVTGPGYRAEAVADDYAPGTEQLVEVRFEAPEEPLTGRLCVRNGGRRPVTLLGTDEPKSVSRAETTVDDEVQPGDAELTLLEGEPRPLAERPAQVVDRAAALSGLPEALLWLVLVLVLAFPLLGALALVSPAARDGGAAPPAPRSARASAADPPP